MKEIQIFNLERIKKSTDPIEILQGKINDLSLIYNNFIENKNIIAEDFGDSDFLNNIQFFAEMLNKFTEKLLKISNENINKFLIFQDHLIKNYKDNFKENLKNLKLEHNFTKELGLYLIEDKKISKIIAQCAYVPAINIEQWIEILESLEQNSLILSTIKKIEKFYDLHIRDKLNIELTKISKNVDPILIKDYKEAYLKEPMSFAQFLSELENKFTKEELVDKKILIKITKEKEKLDQLKKKQVEQRKSYDDYLKLSGKEFQRRRRKKKREKLPEITAKSNKSNEIELTEEISEKIEQFKSKFEDSFEEKYLIQNNDEKDPLEVIRERRKLKEEEYKDYLKKFKSEEE